MSETEAPNSRAECYLILLKGQIDNRWLHWFEGFRISYKQDGTTLLYAWVADQSDLHGLLRKVRDLGLPLLIVLQVKTNREIAQKLEEML